MGLAALGVFVSVSVACGGDDPVGPPNPNGKVAGLACTSNDECQSLTCKAGKCTAVTGGNPTDNVKNGDETDVDCGGSAPRCADGKACKIADDCTSGVCTGNVCKAPAPDDNIKNGDETDVDCGGATAPKCAADKACAKNEDCASSACSYAKKCVAFPSCTGHFGGDTCGPGDTGTGEAKHESCCATVESGGTTIGKYLVTAGRMRAFVERFSGNLQQWAATNPPNWDSSWNDELPSSMEEALDRLGPNVKRGCSVPNQGGRTYWQKDANGDPDETSDFSQDTLDEKALNCVPWHLAQALCHFDGGRLASSDEIFSLVTNDGSTSFPWGNSPGFVTKAQSDLIVHFFSYLTPNPPASLRTNGEDPLDKAFFMAPPGRRPGGNNKAGAADAVGNMLPWVNDGVGRFSWTASWEEHPLAGFDRAQGGSQRWPPSGGSGEQWGYYAIGARCAFDR